MLVLISNATTIQYLCLGTLLYILHDNAKQNKINQMKTLENPEFMKINLRFRVNKSKRQDDSIMVNLLGAANFYSTIPFPI